MMFAEQSPLLVGKPKVRQQAINNHDSNLQRNLPFRKNGRIQIMASSSSIPVYPSTEADELHEIMKWETSIQPPPLDELRKCTKDAFSCKYIKYMYSRFKNECPTGKMRLSKFKKMFGAYLPTRLNDEYVLRLFTAFANGKEEITFQDLMESLALLCLPTPETNAIWTIRMIKGCDVEAITQADLVAFVNSVFQLTLREKSKKTIAPESSFHMVNEAFQNIVLHRSQGTFKALDKDGDGYIRKCDFIDFFRQEGYLDPIFMKSSTRLKI